MSEILSRSWYEGVRLTQKFHEQVSAVKDIDKLKGAELNALMKEFTMNVAGWDWEKWKGLPCYSNQIQLMKLLPGSFASEWIAEDCPVREVSIQALMDLAPKLISEGKSNRYLAFGYGRRWYSIGYDYENAEIELNSKYPYQYCIGKPVMINDELLETSRYKEYTEWKELRDAGKPSRLIPGMSFWE